MNDDSREPCSQPLPHPVPTPRTKRLPLKPPPPAKVATETIIDPQLPITTKPKVTAKPIIAKKPKNINTSDSKPDHNGQEVRIAPASSEKGGSRLDEGSVKTIDGDVAGQEIKRTRPLSVKVTEDGVHGKVAQELASILGRPRSTSKGLLSPTDYSEKKGSVATSSSGGSSSTNSPGKHTRCILGLQSNIR